MLEIANLTAGYGALTVLHDVSLRVGDGEAVALLEKMNIAMFRLRQALLAGDEAAYQAQRSALKGLSAAWLYHAPLHKVAELLPPEGEA